MNHHLNGTPLTRADLIALALEAGMSATKVAHDVKTWVFAEASRGLRFEKWARGELLLRTQTHEFPEPSLTIDWEFVAVVTRGRITGPTTLGAS